MATASGPRVIGATLVAEDVDGLRAFYERVFGIEFFSEDHGDGLHHHATGGEFAYPDGFFLFTLWPSSREWPATSASLSLVVADVDVAYERALAAGGRSLAAPFDSDAFPRSAIFADPAGNHLQIYASA
jgi:predicted enzyme related to lactoylglutathione lyase